MKYLNLMYNRQYLVINLRPRNIYPSSFRFINMLSNHQRVMFSTNTEASEITLKHRKKSRIPLINWFYEDFLSGRVKINSFYLYAEITKQVEYPKFFDIFHMEDTFNSWFLITELHVWMLMARLRGDGKDGRTASRTLVSALWDDATSRSKVLSPGDSSTSKKQIQILSNEFRASLLIYDEGLLGSDTVLASALWYRFLGKSCDDPRLIELLTVYVRNQINNLESITKEDMLERASIRWKPISDQVKILNI